MPEKEISSAGEKLKLKRKIIPPESGEMKPDGEEMSRDAEEIKPDAWEMHRERKTIPVNGKSIPPWSEEITSELCAITLKSWAIETDKREACSVMEIISCESEAITF